MLEKEAKQTYAMNGPIIGKQVYYLFSMLPSSLGPNDVSFRSLFHIFWLGLVWLQ